jgi:hypothetical protein
LTSGRTVASEVVKRRRGVSQDPFNSWVDRARGTPAIEVLQVEDDVAPLAPVIRSMA